MFYRASGFHDTGRVEGFFDRYPEPVVEDGVRGTQRFNKLARCHRMMGKLPLQSREAPCRKLPSSRLQSLNSRAC